MTTELLRKRQGFTCCFGWIAAIVHRLMMNDKMMMTKVHFHSILSRKDFFLFNATGRQEVVKVTGFDSPNRSSPHYHHHKIVSVV